MRYSLAAIQLYKVVEVIETYEKSYDQDEEFSDAKEIFLKAS